MRIAQISPYSVTVPGGVQGQVLGLARTLRAMGHEARVLAPCDGPPPDEMVTPLGNSIPTAANGSMAPIAPDPACALRTIHALRNEDFDILHLHEPLVPGPTFTSLLVSDKPSVGTFHAAGSRLGYDKATWITRTMAKRLDVRVAVSHEARHTAEHNLRGRYEVLFNGIEIDRFANGAVADKSGPTIFFVGRHEQRKGLSMLVDAMKHLPSDVTLWVAGHGPQTAQLKAVTKDDERIVWLGRITEVEKAERLRATDVFCAPSLGGESFGIVLLEAMAAGAPVVASDLPGYRNVVDGDEQQALLTPVGNGEALVNAIEVMLSDAALADRLRRNGRARAEHFSMQRLAREYLRFYQIARELRGL